MLLLLMWLSFSFVLYNLPSLAWLFSSATSGIHLLNPPFKSTSLISWCYHRKTTMKMKWWPVVRTDESRHETQRVNAELKHSLLVSAFCLFAAWVVVPGILRVLGKYSPLSYFSNLLFVSFIWRRKLANLPSLTTNLWFSRLVLLSRLIVQACTHSLLFLPIWISC